MPVFKFNSYCPAGSLVYNPILASNKRDNPSWSTFDPDLGYIKNLNFETKCIGFNHLLNFPSDILVEVTKLFALSKPYNK